MKTCNNVYGQCIYRMMSSGTFTGCDYIGYCDHQLPIDSRGQYPAHSVGIPVIDLCSCGGQICSDGVTCNLCGKRKY